MGSDSEAGGTEPLSPCPAPAPAPSLGTLLCHYHEMAFASFLPVSAGRLQHRGLLLGTVLSIRVRQLICILFCFKRKIFPHYCYPRKQVLTARDNGQGPRPPGSQVLHSQSLVFCFLSWSARSPVPRGLSGLCELGPEYKPESLYPLRTEKGARSSHKDGE